jgi:N-acetylmuramoyl-L-alanine amidase
VDIRGHNRGLGVRSIALAALAWLAGSLGPSFAADLLGVRFGASDKNTTRVVFDLTGAADYALSGDEGGAGSLIVDLSGVAAAAGAGGSGAGHVSSYAVSTNGSGARAVLTFGRTARIKDKPFLLAPKDGVSHHRLVIDLVTADKAAFIASLPAAPPPAPEQYATQKLDDVLAAVAAPEPAAEEPGEAPIIVIDAGHGGADPGARGPSGVLEKTVTLAAAKQLAALLEAKGQYRIVLTRADDTRLGLEDRSKAARDAKAELFISLHADANDNAKLRGGSVYTLSEAGGERSEREAKAQGDYHVYGENIKEADPQLGGILFDLAQRDTQNASSIFAEKLLKSLDGVTPLLNNSHRTGDLFVLLSPDVPAVLFELAFISNKHDEANLNSPAWRERAMTAVAEAIDTYFEARKPAQHAANAARRSP